MIRGAVAFGLVLRIDQDVPHRSVIVTTSLGLVCFTTIFLGSTVATVQRCLFGNLKKAKHGSGGGNLEDADESHHDEIVHPNIEDVNRALQPDEPTPIAKTRKQKCGLWCRRFDKETLKPFLIYKYKSDTHRKQKEYFEIMVKDGAKFEEIFADDKNQHLLTPKEDAALQVIEMHTRKSQNFNTPSENPYDNI